MLLAFKMFKSFLEVSLILIGEWNNGWWRSAFFENQPTGVSVNFLGQGLHDMEMHRPFEAVD